MNSGVAVGKPDSQHDHTTYNRETSKYSTYPFLSGLMCKMQSASLVPMTVLVELPLFKHIEPATWEYEDRIGLCLPTRRV